uniref:ribonuclease Z n=1 Tax=Ditylenchus dipsaci TaxID=166011 RepID=A0A915DWB0_9BILA
MDGIEEEGAVAAIIVDPKQELPDSLDNNVRPSMSSKKMKLDSENGKSSSAKAASFASLEIISNGTTHTGPSVVLKTDKNTYIFNCPEGTCRFQSAMRLRPNTTYDFFITRGYFRECRLHGPKNIRQYLDDLRPFLDSDKSFDKYSMLMEERNYERGSYQDEILSVQYIPLMIELAKPPMKLKDGNAVTLPDGRTIEPEQIYAEAQVDHGKPFLVADVISEEKLNCLTSSSILQKFMNGSQQLGFITFGDKCEHIVVNGSGGTKTVAPQIDSPYLQQMMLNTLDPITFPLLHPRGFSGVVTQDHGGECPSPNVVVPTSIRRFAVRGKLPMSDLIAFTFTVSGLACRINAAPEVTPLIENFLEYTKSIADREQDKYPQISFLGTSSASPTRYRNVSGHLLHLNQNSVVMVDCGELTYGQLRVLYGEAECERILLNLHTICITHAHQDHLNGLIMLIEKRESAFKKHGLEYKPLILLASRRALKPLTFYSGLFRDLTNLI